MKTMIDKEDSNASVKPFKLHQNMSNMFGRLGLKPVMDCDLVAINLIRSGKKITEKDVEGYIQHLLTYVHPKIDNAGIGWMSMVGKKHDDLVVREWVSGVLKSLKAVVRSRVEAELDKNIEIRNRIFDKFADKNEGSHTIGSAVHSELDDVVAPLNKQNV